MARLIWAHAGPRLTTAERARARVGRGAVRSVCPQEAKGNEKHVTRILDYRAKIENELKDICTEVTKILQSSLIPKASTAESKVFYYKMVGDYHRYMAEFSTGDSRSKAAELAMEGYNKASGIAEQELSPTNPIRLGLALNFSVFFYEVMNSP